MIFEKILNEKEIIEASRQLPIEAGMNFYVYRFPDSTEIIAGRMAEDVGADSIGKIVGEKIQPVRPIQKSKGISR